MAEQQV